MAIPEYNYIPKYTKLEVNNKPKDVVTASYWNGLFNSLSNQGDHTAKELGNVLNHFTAAINEVKGIADDKYVKPTDGIPKSDLAQDVQNSLNKANTALQEHQSLAAYRTAFAQDIIDSGLGDRISAIENKESGWDDKQDKLIAGENITIAVDGKTISATGGGAKAFFLNVFVITETQVVTNKTYAEIKAAIDAGDIIYITDKNGIVYVPQVGTNSAKIELLWIESQGNRTLYWTAVVDSENAWNAAEFELVDIDKLVFELSDKVDKETGKGLSTNDYTYADKAKVNDLKPVATSGSYSDLTDKPTIPSVPTATINANAAARHEHSNKTVLDLISETVKAAWDAASTWVTTNGANVLSHLSDSVKHITAAERTAWNGKQDKLIAGDNITIAADGKTISATGGSGSTIELDTTLSETGKAADAKAVGNALTGKQNTISDLETIRSGAAKGATALQSVPSTYRTALAQDVIDSDLGDRIEVIEGKEAGWNSKYSKPTGGIPKTDLASSVQMSLGKADTALQNVPSTYRTAAAQDVIDSGKVDKVTGKGLSTNDYTDAAKAKVDAIPAVDSTLTVSGAAADANETGTRFNTLSGKIDNFIASGGFSAPIVDSVDEMVDTSKQYILKSTGTIWAYKSATTEQEVTVTDEIEATDANPYKDNTRLGSSGDDFSAKSGYHVTPLIDLTKYTGKTIQIHLNGCQYSATGAYANYIQCRIYGVDKSVLATRPWMCDVDDGSVSNTIGLITNGIVVTYGSNTSTTVTVECPAGYASVKTEIGYIRFCGKGAVANSNIYITYIDTQTVTSEQWVDTGIQYGGGGLDAETAAKISELNNEGNSPSTIKLLPKPVLDFYNAAAYSDSDYSYSHLEKITYPCRADIPVPYTVKWNYNESAMRTTVVVDTRAIGTVNAYTLRTYDATGLNKFPIYNLLPNKTYYYKVTHVMADGSLVEAKSGSFTTSNEAWRLLYIDGTQNVRDLGGWTGLNGKKVKYGKIIRGAALNDSSLPELLLTGKGRRSLGELAIQAELNLGAIDTETSIASNCVYKKIGYTNYAIAFTGETYRAQFKEVLEWIVEQLTSSKPIYMHCQGGCDRTGTLAFQLLGLLGVSESDLAKEYELSSFSNIGFGRLRTTTEAVNTYDYVGMVEALKAYSGSTISDKFYDFATTGCGISADTITNFRNLMLE